MAANDVLLKDQSASPVTFYPETDDLTGGVRRPGFGMKDGANVTLGAKADAAWDGAAAAPTSVGIFKAIALALLGSLKVVGQAVAVSAVPAVTAGAYAAGNVIGGKLTLSNVARVPGGTGTIVMANVLAKIANTTPIDLLVFHADPTASTITDKTALAIDPADFDKLSGVFHIADWTSIGTPSLGQDARPVAFKCPAGISDLFVVPVARGAVTFASTSDIKIAVKAEQN